MTSPARKRKRASSPFLSHTAMDKCADGPVIKIGRQKHKTWKAGVRRKKKYEVQIAKKKKNMYSNREKGWIRAGACRQTALTRLGGKGEITGSPFKKRRCTGSVSSEKKNVKRLAQATKSRRADLILFRTKFKVSSDRDFGLKNNKNHELGGGERAPVKGGSTSLKGAHQGRIYQ